MGIRVNTRVRHVYLDKPGTVTVVWIDGEGVPCLEVLHDDGKTSAGHAKAWEEIPSYTVTFDVDEFNLIMTVLHEAMLDAEETNQSERRETLRVLYGKIGDAS